MIIAELNKKHPYRVLEFRDSSALFENESLASLTAYDESDMLELNLNSVSPDPNQLWSTFNELVEALVAIDVSGRVSLLFSDRLAYFVCKSQLEQLAKRQGEHQSAIGDFHEHQFEMVDFTQIAKYLTLPDRVAKLALNTSDVDVTVSFDLGPSSTPTVYCSFINTSSSEPVVSKVTEIFLTNGQEQVSESVNDAIVGHLDRSW